MAERLHFHFLSLGMFSRLVYAISYVSTSFLFVAEKYPIVEIYHIYPLIS